MGEEIVAVIVPYSRCQKMTRTWLIEGPSLYKYRSIGVPVGGSSIGIVGSSV